MIFLLILGKLPIYPKHKTAKLFATLPDTMLIDTYIDLVMIHDVAVVYLFACFIQGYAFCMDCEF